MSLLILLVPHVLQRQPGECLAACAAMMLTYLGLSLNYDHLLNLLRVRAGIGTPAFNIRNLEKLGITVLYQQGTLAELQEHLAHNRPCLSLVQTGELPYWAENCNHAVFVTGLDDHDVYLNDPAFVNAPIQVACGDFDLAWLSRDEFYAVFIRPG
jgi:ABC-type bacteriocin/lantibiotic exporter with double-glycine peptidase domain